MKKSELEKNSEKSNDEKQNEKTKTKLKALFILLVTIILISAIVCLKPYIRTWLYQIITIENLTSISGERLVFKSKLAEQKIIQYDFKEGVLCKVKIQEKYNSKTEFEQAKQVYSNDNKYKILFMDDDNLTILVEKMDFGVDKDLSYEQIYEKYIVQIIGAYEVL